MNQKLSQMQEEYFKNSVCRDEDGKLLTFYHGTEHAFDAFQPEFANVGNMQYGSGFYFTTNMETALCYTTEENSKVIQTYLNLENPYFVDNGNGSSPNLKAISVPFLDAKDILLKNPNFYKSTEDGNLLGDYLEEYWEVCDSLKNASDFKPLIVKLANRYFAEDADLFQLDVLFNGCEDAFRQAVFDVTGHDGIMVYMGNGELHGIAFFPNQIKEIENLYPTKSDLLMEYEPVKKTCVNIEGVDIPLHKDGTISLFHRTGVEQAKQILATNTFLAKEPAIYFSTEKSTEYNEGYGDVALEFRIKPNAVTPDDIFQNEVHMAYQKGCKRKDGAYQFDVSSILADNKELKKQFGLTKESQVQSDDKGKDFGKTLDDLAEKLRKLCEDFDPYEYHDVFDGTDKNYAFQTSRTMILEDKQSAIDFCKNILESDNAECHEDAKAVLKMIADFSDTIKAKNTVAQNKETNIKQKQQTKVAHTILADNKKKDVGSR